MIRMILAAATAFALASAAPAVAACKDCPMHKEQVTAAGEVQKPEGEKAPACACAGEGKECKCGAQCMCAHCGAKKAEKKDEGKKS